MDISVYTVVVDNEEYQTTLSLLEANATMEALEADSSDLTSYGSIDVIEGYLCSRELLLLISDKLKNCEC